MGQSIVFQSLSHARISLNIEQNACEGRSSTCWSHSAAGLWTRQLWIHYIVIAISICALALTGGYFYNLVYWYMKLMRRVLHPLLAKIELSTEDAVIALTREKNQAYAVQLTRHRYGIADDDLKDRGVLGSLVAEGETEGDVQGRWQTRGSE